MFDDNEVSSIKQWNIIWNKRTYSMEILSNDTSLQYFSTLHLSNPDVQIQIIMVAGAMVLHRCQASHQ